MSESKIRSVHHLEQFPEISNHLDILGKLGQGTFASVFAVRYRENPSNTYALKMLIPTVDVRRIENEIRTLKRLGFYLVDFGLAHSEEYGDIDERWERKFNSTKQDSSCKIKEQTSANEIKSIPETTPRFTRRRSSQQLDSNVNFKNVNKSNNQNSPSLKPQGSCVCGFRLTICRSCKQLPRAPLVRRGGTLGFRPPEVMMRSSEQSTSVDIWAVGVILLSFLSGRYPFIKVEDDLDVLHAFTHLTGYERMQLAARSIGRKIFMDPKPYPMKATDTPASWLKSRCVAIRKHEKKLAKIPPLLCNLADEKKENSKPTNAFRNENISTLPANHSFPNSVYDLLARLLEPNPYKRISAHDALKHSYLT